MARTSAAATQLRAYPAFPAAPQNGAGEPGLTIAFFLRGPGSGSERRVEAYLQGRVTSAQRLTSKAHMSNPLWRDERPDAPYDGGPGGDPRDREARFRRAAAATARSDPGPDRGPNGAGQTGGSRNDPRGIDPWRLDGDRGGSPPGPARPDGSGWPPPRRGDPAGGAPGSGAATRRPPPQPTFTPTGPARPGAVPPGGPRRGGPRPGDGQRWPDGVATVPRDARGTPGVPNSRGAREPRGAPGSLGSMGSRGSSGSRGPGQIGR